jgi:drug/metabolite transporter (DMT)-like permease
VECAAAAALFFRNARVSSFKIIVMLHNLGTPVKRAGWLGLTIAAIGLWGLYGIALKLASQLSPVAGQLLSTAGLLLPALFLIRPVARERRSTAGLFIGVISGVCGALGNFAVLASLRADGKAAIVFPLTALYPLITVIVAVVFMRERAGRAQVVGIALAIVAVLLLVIDVSASYTSVDLKLSNALVYAFAALVAFGLAAVFQKLATNRVSAETAFATFAAGFIPPTILLLLLGRVGTNLPLAPVLWAIAGGLLNGLGVLATLAAYRRGGKASVVTPLAAIYPMITVILAVVFLDEKLVAVQIGGILLALIGGVLLSRE